MAGSVSINTAAELAAFVAGANAERDAIIAELETLRDGLEADPVSAVVEATTPGPEGAHAFAVHDAGVAIGAGLAVVAAILDKLRGTTARTRPFVGRDHRGN